MAEYMVLIWLVVFIVMLVIEFITVEFVTVWFAISAIPTAIIAWLLPELFWLQFTVFFGLGFILMLFIRSYLLKYFKRNAIATNVDSYVGKDAVVTKKISSLENGLVKFQSITWTAVSQEDIAEGQTVRILAIDGNKFIVTKIKE